LVKLPAGSRVADAVAAAGGVTPQADLTGINLASAVADGAQVMVPGQQAAGDPAMVADGRVRINQAGPAELEQLPGVGPVLARRIFEYREAHGPFRTIEDLLGVPGVGEGKLEAIREAAVVS
jgi:competence protein ComEA